jgi:hypothetical protein
MAPPSWIKITYFGSLGRGIQLSISIQKQQIGFFCVTRAFFCPNAAAILFAITRSRVSAFADTATGNDQRVYSRGACSLADLVSDTVLSDGEKQWKRSRNQNQQTITLFHKLIRGWDKYSTEPVNRSSRKPQAASRKPQAGGIGCSRSTFGLSS